MRTGPEFYDALLAAWITGAVPVPLYPPLNLGALRDYDTGTARMLGAASCKLLLTEAMIRPFLARAARTAGLALPPVVLGDAEDGDVRPYAARADDPALIQFSSGTTGQPKGALLTHGQIMANIEAIHALVLGVAPEDAGFRHVCVCWLPLYHDMGLIGCLIAAMAHGADLVLIPPEVFLAEPVLWLRAISDHGGTVSPAPNFAFSYCADRVSDDALAGIDLSRWRLALNGAEAVTGAAMTAFCDRFGPYGFSAEALTPVYGLSEATLLVTADRRPGPVSPVAFDEKALLSRGLARPATPGSARTVELVSVGHPVAGTSVEIRAPDGTPSSEGMLGEIYVRGPSLMSGYVGTTAQGIGDGGWFRTGDLGFLHDGELFLFSRADDVLVIRGRNFAPEGFERAATSVAGVRRGRAAALAIGDTGTGTGGVMILAERRSKLPLGDAALVREITRRILEETGIRPAGVKILKRGALPCTSSGKVRRGEARCRFVLGWSGATPAAAPALAAEAMQ
jgi:acyl-CoA synthetase (AMP-forming)/AMP-acid ligase II